MATMEKVYLDAQTACGLQVGDYVKILCKVESNQFGWQNVWRSEKDACVGKIGKIDGINVNGIVVRFGKDDDDGFYFPYFVLEKVEKPKHEFKPFDKVLVRDCSDEEWRCNIFSHIHAGDFLCVGNGCWNHCIPYEGNEHLVGTTAMPEE